MAFDLNAKVVFIEFQEIPWTIMMAWLLTHTTLELPLSEVEINVRSWEGAGGGILAVTMRT